MLNRVMLIGRLTSAPEFKRTPNTGAALATFTLAVDRYWQSSKDKPAGQKETDFIRIVAWAKLAERCHDYLDKGRMVAVDGRLMVRNWETPGGERRTIVEVRADDIRFLERAPKGAEPQHYGHEDDELPPPEYPAGSGYSSPKRDFGKPSAASHEDTIDFDDDDPFKEG